MSNEANNNETQDIEINKRALAFCEKMKIQFQARGGLRGKGLLKPIPLVSELVAARRLLLSSNGEDCE